MTYHSGMGTTPPICVSQAEHDAAVIACKKTQVRGIGAVAGIDPCQLKLLPICTYVRSNISTTSYTPPPPPVDISTPPVPPPEGEPSEADEPNYMLWGGLGLLLVAAGGYVVYKTTKKNR